MITYAVDLIEDIATQRPCDYEAQGGCVEYSTAGYRCFTCRAKMLLRSEAQDQRSLSDQMIDLLALANNYGLYDAAAWLEQKIER